MPLTPKPVHPLFPVAAAVAATFCFIFSEHIPTWPRFLLLAVGLALLVWAISSVAATRRGAPGTGWRPSRDGSAREEADREQP